MADAATQTVRNVIASRVFWRCFTSFAMTGFLVGSRGPTACLKALESAAKPSFGVTGSPVWKVAKEAEAKAGAMEGVGRTHRFVDPDSPNTIFPWLEFDSEEAAAAQLASPMMKEYGAKITPLIESWDVYMQYTVSKAESLKPLNE